MVHRFPKAAFPRKSWQSRIWPAESSFGKDSVEEDAAVAAELKVREQIIEKKRKGFRKNPTLR